MKRIILIYGLIVGTILSVNIFYMVSMCYSDRHTETNDVVGYAALIVVFSLIFFGIRNYRNQYAEGFISFGKAFKIGVLISLVASVMYVVVWLFYYYLFVPDFLDKYIPFALKEASRKGATAVELAAKTKDLEQLREMYKNPFFVVIITLSEVFPIGLIVAVISSLILKRKPR